MLELLPGTASCEPLSDESAYEEVMGRLRKYWQETDVRCEDLRAEPASAEAFTRPPHGRPARLTGAAARCGSGVAR